MPVEFERNGEGIYVPADTPDKRVSFFQQLNSALGGAWLTTAINAFLVLIQLLTVCILWLTYQNTVLPTRQKELLSEQLAQLELERKQVVAGIDKARGEAKLAQRALEEKQRALEALSEEKDRLAAEAAEANRTAAASLSSAQLALSQAGKASKELGVAQLSIFQQHASLIVAAPRSEFMHERMRRLVREVNEAIADQDKKESIETFLDGIRSTWPRMDVMAADVARKLRTSKSSLFPASFADSLARHIEDRAKQMTCDHPDYGVLRTTYESQIKAERDKEVRELDKRYAGYVAEGREKGIRYIIGDETRAAELSLIESSAESSARRELRKTVEAIAEKCFDRFEEMADGYFHERGVKIQTIPPEAGPLR